MIIPTKEKKWIQPNKGDVFGNLWATFNMDFDSMLGKVRVAPRVRINTDSTDDSLLGIPTAFVRSAAGGTDRWWALCGTLLFRTAGTDPSDAFTIATTDDGGTTVPPSTMTAISSDMVEFEGALIVSDTTDLNRLNGGVWNNAWWLTTLVQSALTSGIAHPLCVTVKTNLLLIGDANKIHTIDKNSNVKTSRVILKTEFEIIWIRSSPDGTWIGARNKVNREAEVFYWDEVAENFNRHYGVKSDRTFAGVIKNGILHTVNGEGQLLKFTGSGFEEEAVFPCFKQSNKRLKDANTVNRNVHRNGMAVIDEKIHINISSQINNTFSDLMENFPSGIWTFDETQGLRHKYALTLYRTTEIDYGSFIIEDAGALVPTDSSFGLFLVGGTIRSNSTTAVPAIFYRDTLTNDDSYVKRGHFITSIIESASFEDLFQNLLLTFKRFRNSGDRIIVKYRTLKNPNYPIQVSGTWSSTTVFTTTDSLANASAGDEVMVLRGRGAGALAKISTITEAGGTYTVTLAEAITAVSGTAQFLVGDWTEAATVSTQSIERQEFDLDAVGTFIQLKVELRSAASTAGAGDSPELEKIGITQVKDEVI